MKKGLKIWLIIWWSLLVTWWAWSGLTKTWVIPNRLWIEILCNWSGLSSDKYSLWENEKNDTNNHDRFIAPKWYYQDSYNNLNKYQRCVDECENISISWYTHNWYIDWCFSEKCEEFFYKRNIRCYSWKIACFWWKDLSYRYLGARDSLSSLPLYSEWINNRFYWFENDIKQYETCMDKCNIKYPVEAVSDKPIIYLYPTEETQVNVKLWTPENLLYTYPKYSSEKWRNVIAQPNGDLEDIGIWRKLYALYREWKSDIETNFDEWFVVPWKDIIPFLEEKLSILWLNEREAEEFIVYWLPQMENNKYNLIRFETKEEQDENMPLNITPKPDTVIRVMMDWKSTDEPIDIPEQKLTTPERNWFTVVEWWWSPRN